MDFRELLTFIKGSFDTSLLIAFAFIAFTFRFLKVFAIWFYKVVITGKDLHEKIQDVEPMKKDIEEIKIIIKQIQEEIRELKKAEIKNQELIKHKFEGIKNLLKK
jgi:hypothetical protein